MVNSDYLNFKKEFYEMIYQKLIGIKNIRELEKLSSVFVYLRTKITLK